MTPSESLIRRVWARTHPARAYPPTRTYDEERLFQVATRLGLTPGRVKAIVGEAGPGAL